MTAHIFKVTCLKCNAEKDEEESRAGEDWLVYTAMNDYKIVK